MPFLSTLRVDDTVIDGQCSLPPRRCRYLPHHVPRQYFGVVGRCLLASASAGIWFHCLLVLFSKQYIPMSVPCFLTQIFRFRSCALR
jgi:hypothetical protein